MTGGGEAGEPAYCGSHASGKLMHLGPARHTQYVLLSRGLKKGQSGVIYKAGA